MCGIAGIVVNGRLNVDPKGTAEKMAATLYHRGPDGAGFYTDDSALLVHTRLSIIDLAGGTQPIHNSDKSVWVTFNGEIFNFIELRKELQNKGYRFYTKTDTEVIVHLYDEYGEDFVQYLNGQFAIGLWDTKRNKLILVRDRPGIVPLFFKKTSDRLFFGSEVKSILAVTDDYTPSLDLEALDQLLTFWAPIEGNTLFSGIESLRPGEMAVYEKGELKKRKYWEWTFPDKENWVTGPVDELAHQLHDLLVDATQIRLRSDVPVGAYLSGGLDSSVLTSLIHHHSDAPLRTFSLTFEDKGLDENAFQQQMIQHLGAEHSSVLCTYEKVAENFLDSIWHSESALVRTAPVPMGVLSGLVREQNYKVVLTGEGADEVFGGYDIFKETKLRQFWALQSQSAFRPLLLKRLYPYLEISPGRAQVYLQNFFGAGVEDPSNVFFSHTPRWSTTAKIKHFYSEQTRESLSNSNSAEKLLEQTLPQAMQRWNPFQKAQYIEAKTLMGCYLLNSQGDRMLMKNSVEGRFPFLDHRVIEFGNSLDPRLKMHVLNEKYLLKKACGKYLPGQIVQRPKQPYRAPDIPSFFGRKTPDYVNDLLSEERLKGNGYFDAKRVGMLLKKIKAGRSIGYKDNMSLIAILSTQAWRHLFVDEFSRRSNPKGAEGVEIVQIN